MEILFLLPLFVSAFLSKCILTNAEVNISCSHKSPTEEYCPGDVATFMCNTTHKLLEWTVRDQEVDFHIIDKVGAVERGHTNNISGVLVQHDPFFSSLLTLTVHESLNNTPVRCTDIPDGKNKTCRVKIFAPPNQPMDLRISFLNSTSLRVKWTEPSGPQRPMSLINNPQQKFLYRVTARPTDCGSHNEQLMYCDKTARELTEKTLIDLFNLDLLREYVVSVQALSCNGKLASYSLSNSVNFLKHSVRVESIYCHALFHINITWEGYEQDRNMTTIITLSNQTFTKTIHHLLSADVGFSFNTAFSSLQMVGNLTENTQYNWTVLLVYDDHKPMELESGYFYTYTNCNTEEGYSVAAVASISSVGVVIVFILLGIPIALAAVMFWMCKKEIKRDDVIKSKSVPENLLEVTINKDGCVLTEDDISNKMKASYSKESAVIQIEAVSTTNTTTITPKPAAEAEVLPPTAAAIARTESSAVQGLVSVEIDALDHFKRLSSLIINSP